MIRESRKVELKLYLPRCNMGPSPSVLVVDWAIVPMESKRGSCCDAELHPSHIDPPHLVEAYSRDDTQYPTRLLNNRIPRTRVVRKTR